MTRWGGDPALVGNAPDDPALIQDRIAAGARHDILVTPGGVSVGDHDLVRDVL